MAADTAAAPGVSLSSVPPGGRCRVLDLRLAAAERARLMEMGLTRGAQVTVLRLAPLGDPMEVRVRGYALSLRRAEAAEVLVEVLP